MSHMACHTHTAAWDGRRKMAQACRLSKHWLERWGRHRGVTGCGKGGGVQAGDATAVQGTGKHGKVRQQEGGGAKCTQPGHTHCRCQCVEVF